MAICPPARSTALRSARPVSTRAISFLYSTDAAPVGARGSCAAAARRAASAMTVSSGFFPARYFSASVGLDRRRADVGEADADALDGAAPSASTKAAAPRGGEVADLALELHVGAAAAAAAGPGCGSP